jgi:hypothetical protein
MIKNIKGAIGYSILIGKKPIKILLFSDNHDNLKYCNNAISIADFLKNKQDICNILLEEVIRDNIELGELWTNSEHSIELKNLFLSENNKIYGIDIRPFLITF